MSLPASDNFNRADANPVGGNWTGANSDHQIVSNKLQGITFNYSLSYWSADAFNADHYSQFLASHLSDGGPAVRVSTSNCYNLTMQAGQCRIDKVVAGSFTQLQSGLAGASDGDTGYCEVVGTTIKVKVNGVQRGTDQTDSSLSSGAAGIFNFDANGIYDDFLADNIGGAVALAPPAGGVAMAGLAGFSRQVASNQILITPT